MPSAIAGNRQFIRCWRRHPPARWWLRTAADFIHVAGAARVGNTDDDKPKTSGRKQLKLFPARMLGCGMQDTATFPTVLPSSQSLLVDRSYLGTHVPETGRSAENDCITSASLMAKDEYERTPHGLSSRRFPTPAPVGTGNGSAPSISTSLCHSLLI